MMPPLIDHVPRAAAALDDLRAEADALARDAAAMDAIMEQPGALLAAARAAGMPVLEYVKAHIMPTKARALIARQRADAMRRGMDFEPPLFSAVCPDDGRLAEQRARFVDDRP